jgi:hypothetical protein
MTGKTDQLKRLAEDLRCANCRSRPRIANRQVCRECLRLAEERERKARSRLVPNPGRSNHQQAAASRARKPPAAPTGKALVPARSVQPVPQRTRDTGEPFTLKTWAAMGARWLTQFLRAKPVEQREKAERAMAAEHVTQNIGFARLTYGTVPIAALYPRSNQELAVVQWGLERQGVKIDMIETFGDVQDVKTLCTFCGARVRVPCTEARAQSCRNRSRNW